MKQQGRQTFVKHLMQILFIKKVLRKQKIIDKGETVFEVNSFLNYPQGLVCALKYSIQLNIIGPRGQTLHISLST